MGQKIEKILDPPKNGSEFRYIKYEGKSHLVMILLQKYCKMMAERLVQWVLVIRNIETGPVFSGYRDPYSHTH